MQFWLANENDTRMAGAALASVLQQLSKTAAAVVFIRGNLGAGKSTLVRGLLTELGVRGVMPSPTYSLVEPYQVGSLNLFHMDAYRMADAAELDYLGLDDATEPGSILLVEWPDHVRDALPAPTIILDLEIAPNPDSHWVERSTDAPKAEEPLDRHSPRGQWTGTRTGTRRRESDPSQDGRADSTGSTGSDSGISSETRQKLVDRHSRPGRRSSRPVDRHNVPASSCDDRSANSLESNKPGDSHVESGEHSHSEYIDSHAPASSDVSFTGSADAGDPGRLLTVHLHGVPVQQRDLLIADKRWRSLTRVVT